MRTKRSPLIGELQLVSPGDRDLQCIGREGLQEDLHAGWPVADMLGLGIAGNDQRRHVGTELARLAQELGPGEMRHRIIANQHVAFTFLILEDVQRFSPVGRLKYRVARILEHGGRRGPHLGVIVEYHNGQWS